MSPRIETGRLQAAHAPSDREYRLETALRAARIGVWDWDLRTGRMDYSDIAREIFGLPRHGEVTTEIIRDLTHAEDLEKTAGIARRALDPAERASEDYVYRIRRADTGAIRWIHAHGEARFAELGGTVTAVRYTGSLQDVTEQYEARSALAQSEHRLRFALEAAGMAVWEADLAKGEITPSPELNRLTGFPEDAAPSPEEYRSRYAPGERERLAAEGEAMMARGETRLTSVIKHILPGDEERWLLVRAQVGPEKTPPFSSVLGVVLDVTEPTRQEQRLAAVAQELRHRLRNLLSIVGVIAGRTWPSDGTAVAGLRSFQGRLQAIGAATDLMFASEHGAPPLDQLAQLITEPYRTPGHDPFRIGGPDCTLSRPIATAVAMALHELCTNAVKYGALSTDAGVVEIRWTEADGRIVLTWTETGGPTVRAPERAGFGSTLLRTALFPPPHRVEVEYPPEGLTATITVMPD